MKLITILAFVLIVSGCSVINACNSNPGACSGGGEYVRVNDQVFKIEKVKL